MNTGKVTGFLIDVKNNKVSVVDFEENLDSLCRLCDCEHIDITQRCIGSIEYDIVCDDEGLFKSDVVVSAVSPDNNVMFVGNLLLCKNDGAGNLASLSKSDIENILRRIEMYIRDNKIIPLLTDVEYL